MKTKFKHKWSWHWYYEPRDLWIGVYWDKTRAGALYLYVCFIPLFPLRLVRYHDNNFY